MDFRPYLGGKYRGFPTPEEWELTPTNLASYRNGHPAVAKSFRNLERANLANQLTRRLAQTNLDLDLVLEFYSGHSAGRSYVRFSNVMGSTASSITLSDRTDMFTQLVDVVLEYHTSSPEVEGYLLLTYGAYTARLNIAGSNTLTSNTRWNARTSRATLALGSMTQTELASAKTLTLSCNTNFAGDVGDFCWIYNLSLLPIISDLSQVP